MAKKKLYDENGNVVKGAKVKKPFYKKIWFWVLILVVGSMAMSGGDEETANQTNEPDQTEVAAETDTTEEAEKIAAEQEKAKADLEKAQKEEEAKKKEQEEKEKAEQEAEKAKADEAAQFDPADYNKDLTFDDLARNPSEHTWKAVTFEGKIIQVMQGDEYSQYRIATNDNYDKVMLIQISSDQLESRILEDDYIRFYGTYIGEHTYESTLGGNITIPAVIVDKFEMK